MLLDRTDQAISSTDLQKNTREILDRIISGEQDRLTWVAAAPVQADRTGDSIKELQSDLKSFLGDKGVTKEELERTINGNVRELPGSFETARNVLATIGNLRAQSDYLRYAELQGGLRIVGADYDLGSGAVDFFATEPLAWPNNP